MTIAQLKVLCTRKGIVLPAKAKKAEYISALLGVETPAKVGPASKGEY